MEFDNNLSNHRQKCFTKEEEKGVINYSDEAQECLIAYQWSWNERPPRSSNNPQIQIGSNPSGTMILLIRWSEIRRAFQTFCQASDCVHRLWDACRRCFHIKSCRGWSRCLDQRDHPHLCPLITGTLWYFHIKSNEAGEIGNQTSPHCETSQNIISFTI